LPRPQRNGQRFFEGQTAYIEIDIAKVSMSECRMSYRMWKPSTRCVKPKLSLKAGGNTTTSNDPKVLWVTVCRLWRPTMHYLLI
jgi:hypothetical protein